MIRCMDATAKVSHARRMQTVTIPVDMCAVATFSLLRLWCASKVFAHLKSRTNAVFVPLVLAPKVVVCRPTIRRKECEYVQDADPTRSTV